MLLRKSWAFYKVLMLKLNLKKAQKPSSVRDVQFSLHFERKLNKLFIVNPQIYPLPIPDEVF